MIVAENIEPQAVCRQLVKRLADYLTKRFAPDALAGLGNSHALEFNTSIGTQAAEDNETGG